MKRTISMLVLMLALICPTIAQNIEAAPEDKSVVYFTRTSSTGFAINFTYFDSNMFIAKFNGPKYYRYECDPGKHVFWAKSENRDYVEADLEAGKIYFIEAVPKMGAVKAGVKLVPVNPADVKAMKRINKLMSKKPAEVFTEQEFAQESRISDLHMQKGLDRYAKEKSAGKNYLKLSKDWFYTPKQSVEAE